MSRWLVGNTSDSRIKCLIGLSPDCSKRNQIERPGTKRQGPESRPSVRFPDTLCEPAQHFGLELQLRSHLHDSSFFSCRYLSEGNLVAAVVIAKWIGIADVRPLRVIEGVEHVGPEV
jgi:hypothetical protein